MAQRRPALRYVPPPLPSPPPSARLTHTDSVAILRALQLPHLAARGYVNLRCVWLVGCPTVHAAAAATADVVFAAAFAVLFPAVPVPDVVAVSCCAQFALTRDAALARPRADYVRYREWLRQTPLSDALSGRVLEYSWHSMPPPTPRGPETCADARSGVWDGPRALPGRAHVLLPRVWEVRRQLLRARV